MDSRQLPLDPAVRFGASLQQVEIAEDHGQEVVEVVGDPAGQLAHGLHLAGLGQLFFQGPAVGDVQQGADDLLAGDGARGGHGALVQEAAVFAVGVQPAELAGIGSGLDPGGDGRHDLVEILRMDAVHGQGGVGERLRFETGQQLDAVADVQRPVWRIDRPGVNCDRQQVQDRLLAFLAAAKGEFGLELLALDPGVLVEQPLPMLGLDLHLQRLQMQVDQHLHLGAQDERVDGLEHHVDRASRIGLEQVRLVAEHRGQEHDGDPGGAPALADQRGGLITVDAWHVQVQQDDREVLVQEPPQGLFAGPGDHDVVAQFLQRAGGGEGVALVVVDDQHLGAQPLRQRRWLGRSGPHDVHPGGLGHVSWPGS